jgi:hypothetical protein
LFLQIKSLVRAGTHKDSTITLAAAKMGEVYGNREDDNILVATAKPVPSSPSEPADFAME